MTDMRDMDKEHVAMVGQLVKPGVDIVKAMTPDKAHLTHMALGIAGEAGEIVDAIKRHTIYGKDLDVDNVVEELGDLEFYMQGLRTTLGLTRDYILQQNIIKLEKRYDKGTYSDAQAQTRADKAPVSAPVSHAEARRREALQADKTDTEKAVEHITTFDPIRVQREKFLKDLGAMDTMAIDHLLGFETVDELKSLGALCHPCNQERVLNLIRQNIIRRTGPK